MSLIITDFSPSDAGLFSLIDEGGVEGVEVVVEVGGVLGVIEMGVGGGSASVLTRRGDKSRSIVI